MTEKTPKVIVNAGMIRAALRKYFGDNSAVLFEVGNSTGHGTNRHIDAIAMGLWPSRGMEVEGVEIKVSRGDWKRELEDHAKADAIQRYCDRWWIAAPKGLIPPAELPATWGLMEYDDGNLRVKVKAPKLEPIPLSRPFVAAMLRRAAKVDTEELRALVAKATESIRQEERSRAQADFAMRSRDAHRVMEKLETIKEKTGIDLDSWTPVGNVVAAIKFATKTDLLSSYHGLHDIAKTMRHLTQEIEKFELPDRDA